MLTQIRYKIKTFLDTNTDISSIETQRPPLA